MVAKINTWLESVLGPMVKNLADKNSKRHLLIISRVFLAVLVLIWIVLLIDWIILLAQYTQTGLVGVSIWPRMFWVTFSLVFYYGYIFSDMAILRHKE